MSTAGSMSNIDLGKSGPVVVEIPPGYKGDTPQTDYYVLQATSNNYNVMVRGIVMNEDKDAAVQNVKRVKVYPLSESSNPKPNKFTSMSGKVMDTTPPKGMAFWSLTLYDTATRSMIQNLTNDSARSSLDKLKTNADGSIALYFGPAGSAPACLEANWIETVPGKGFYPMMRFYSPKAGLFDGTWKLPDIERRK